MGVTDFFALAPSLTRALTFAGAVELGGNMPIRQFAKGAAFNPEAIRRMSLALDDVCAELGLRTRDDPATRLVASKIIKFAQRGILDRGRSKSSSSIEWCQGDAAAEARVAIC
jgi:hypothetical protein